EIEQLNQDKEASLANIEDRPFMVFHPAWGYFEDAYELEMNPIEVGGNEPSAAEMSLLIKEAEAEDIEVIFAQPQFSTRSAKTIANEISGEVILIDPLAEDWLSNMRKVSETFEQVLS
ncbi:MAG: metal ABC transporter solute-binding protein, Zn/Mn family, partial [Pleurocapsa sp.]